jgi:type II secretory pathway component GspD/PulD (secretin)
MHTSGEWLQSDPFTLRATKNDAQGTGSAVTYARRYSLSSILGVAWDDDDDANGCISKTGKAAQNGNQTQKSTAPQTVSDYYQLVTTYARKNKAVGYIVAILKDSFNKTKFSELSLTEAKTFYDHMEELIKKQYELSAKDDAALMDGVG